MNCVETKGGSEIDWFLLQHFAVSLEIAALPVQSKSRRKKIPYPFRSIECNGPTSDVSRVMEVFRFIVIKSI